MKPNPQLQKDIAEFERWQRQQKGLDILVASCVRILATRGQLANQ
jgi:hypothetical protein